VGADPVEVSVAVPLHSLVIDDTVLAVAVAALLGSVPPALLTEGNIGIIAASVVATASIPSVVFSSGETINAASVSAELGIPDVTPLVRTLIDAVAVEVISVVGTADVATVTDAPASPVTSGGYGWMTLRVALAPLTQPLLSACPLCGEPLRENRGIRYCPFDGWKMGS
jgi:hypothetical protein